MSSIGKDIQKAHQQSIDSINRKHNTETKRLEEAHEDARLQMKKNQEIALVDLQTENHRQLLAENEKKDKVLSQIKGNLDVTKKLTDKELEELAVAKKNELNEIQTRYSSNRERINEAHITQLEEMNNRFNQVTHKTNLEGKQRLETMIEQKKEELADRANYQDSRLDKQRDQFVQRFRTDGENFEKIKNQQDETFKKERLGTNQRQSTQMAIMTKTHVDEMEKRDNMKRQGIKDQDLFFEKRYAETIQRHDNHLKNLDGIHDKVLKKMQSDLTTQIELKAQRSQDPFYQFVELKPTVEKTDTGVRIMVQVPEHSKQDLQLNLNGKEAVVNFNRRYIDNQIDQTGNKSRISKIETLSTRLQTGIFLDPKSVKSSYENGVMTYDIKKA